MPRASDRLKVQVRYHGTQAVRYAVAGIVNSCVGYGVFWIANQWAGLHISLANTIGYAAGLVVAYFLNRYFVFAGAPSKGTLLRFLACVGIAFALNQAVLLTLYYMTGLHEGIVQLFGMAAYTLAFFLLNKFVVFRNERPEGTPDQEAGDGARSESSTK